MPFEDYLFIIKRMKKAIQVPFSVDLEAGYGATPAQVIDNITQLYDLGVVGINLEDTWVADGVRHLQNTGVFVNKLARITEGLAAKNIDMFINVRTDVFLLRMPNALEESLHRIEAYQAHKIDGIFLPFAIHEHDIRIVLEQLRVPLNLLCVHDLPSYENLHQWGVKRISMGSLFNAQAYKSLEKTADEVINAQDFTMLFQ